MMWGYGNMGWIWVWGFLMLAGTAVLVLLAVRMFGSGNGYGKSGRQEPGGPPPGRSRARQILDERFAKGELTAEQYRAQLRVLGEGP